MPHGAAPRDPPAWRLVAMYWVQGIRFKLELVGLRSRARGPREPGPGVGAANQRPGACTTAMPPPHPTPTRKSCPYAHPGELARRRPLERGYSAEMCPSARRGAECPAGDSCPFAHSVFEMWLHPSRYRTQARWEGSGIMSVWAESSGDWRGFELSVAGLRP
jgi:hypothetical protein